MPCSLDLDLMAIYQKCPGNASMKKGRPIFVGTAIDNFWQATAGKTP